jgi:excisionase family DNA binding protein
MENLPPKYVSVIQAGAITGLHPNTIRNKIKSGELKAVRAGSRIIRIELSELENLFSEYKRGEFGIWSQII